MIFCCFLLIIIKENMCNNFIISISLFLPNCPKKLIRENIFTLNVEI